MQIFIWYEIFDHIKFYLNKLETKNKNGTKNLSFKPLRQIKWLCLVSVIELRRWVVCKAEVKVIKKTKCNNIAKTVIFCCFFFFWKLT